VRVAEGALLGWLRAAAGRAEQQDGDDRDQDVHLASLQRGSLNVEPIGKHVMSHLPEPLRKKLEAYTGAHRDRQSLVERLIHKRDQAASPQERDTIEQLLWSLVRPRRVPWIIFGVILAIAGVALTVVVVQERKHREAIASGIPTVAKVLRIDDGSCLIGDKSSDCVRLSLELHPKDRPTYRAELTENIKHRFMSRVQPGCWLTVAVNPQRPSEVLFDEESMAVAPPAPIESGR
jgi:hypothetical protein